MKRPLGSVALLYGGGLLLGEFFQPPPAFLFSISLALVAAALLLSNQRRLLLVPLLVLTGWTNFVRQTVTLSPHDLRWQGDQPFLTVIEGRLLETPLERISMRDGHESFRTRATLEVETLSRTNQTQTALGTVVVLTSGLLPANCFSGQRVRINGVLAPPPGPLADGLFDYQAFLRRQGIYYELRADSSNDWQVLPPAILGRPVADRFRDWAKSAITNGLPESDASASLEQALIVGDKSLLTDTVAEPFMRAGTYHIFAVDGLRLSILFGILFTLLRAGRLPRGICGAVLVPLIWFYVAITGWPASAVRAAVMLTIVIAGWSLKRPADLFNSLFGAALVILVWEPQQLFEAGFQLSFFVVLCILLVMPAFDRVTERVLQHDPLLPDELRPRWQRLLDRPLRFIIGLVSGSLAAWLGSLPLVALYFHMVTPISTPANLLAVPLCSLVLASNVLSLLLTGWLSTGAVLFNHAGWFFMECIRVTSLWFQNWPRAWFYVASPSRFTISLYYVIFLAVATGWLFQPPLRRWKYGALTSLVLAWGILEVCDRTATRITVLPLDGASAIYCDAPGQSNDLLVNCGDTNAAALTLKPFLCAQGVNYLSLLALTHGESRCIGGAELVRDIFHVRQVAVSPVDFRSPVYRRLVDELQVNPGLSRLVNGDRLGAWTLLHPNAGSAFPQANDNAMVLRGEFAGLRILLLSDLGRPGQEALLARTEDIRADVVVSGIPAKGEPLSDGLLAAIKPKLIVITDAELPPSKRATAALRERLESRGIPVIYTRTSRAVTLLAGRQRCRITTMDGFELLLPAAE